MKTLFTLSFGMLLFLGACTPATSRLQPPLNASAFPSTHTATVYPSETATPTTTATPQPTETPFSQPTGCQRSAGDMNQVMVNGQTLNTRTLAILSHAASLYGGVIDIEGLAITQGSYTSGEALSFGTHSGGGAVDLSVVARTHFEILWTEIPPLIDALRIAGFAAWLREAGELAPLSPVHIHAIAIGDPQLSEAAEAQLTGPYGYFRGYDGLPQMDGIPHEDRYGGPVLCAWMLELGYRDLRED